FIIELMVANLPSSIQSCCPVWVSLFVRVAEVENNLSRVYHPSFSEVYYSPIHVVPSLSLGMGTLGTPSVPRFELLGMQVLTCDRSSSPVSSVGVRAILYYVGNGDLSFPRFSASLKPHRLLQNL
ncbi:hypothetical protein PMAYCL1PPCAC_08896, partial [Pristionchus mayeri]